MRASGRPNAGAIPALRRPGPVRRRPRVGRIGRFAGWRSACRRPARTRYRCRACGRESWRCSPLAWTRGAAQSRAKGPSTSGRSAALYMSKWAIKKSGFADWNTTTFTDGSASRSVMSVPNSTIVVRDKHVDRRVAERDRPPARMGAVGVELRKVRHGASPTSIGRVQACTPERSARIAE